MLKLAAAEVNRVRSSWPGNCAWWQASTCTEAENNFSLAVQDFAAPATKRGRQPDAFCRALRTISARSCLASAKAGRADGPFKRHRSTLFKEPLRYRS